MRDFSGFVAPPTATARSTRAITPNDTNDLSEIPRALRVGTGGTLVVLAIDDTVPITLLNVADGETIAIMVRKVFATGTTATGIVGFI